MIQLLVHLWGDFVLQSDWMAMNKSKRSLPCLVHVLIYTACFLPLTLSWKALLVIGVTHFLLDRFHMPLKRLIWLKNFVRPELDNAPFDCCNTTGYYDDSPYNQVNTYDAPFGPAWKETIARRFGPPRLFFITMWLYIITDNLLHLTINYLAIAYL